LEDRKCEGEIKVWISVKEEQNKRNRKVSSRHKQIFAAHNKRAQGGLGV
jgi:uncharacterized protein YaeQ